MNIAPVISGDVAGWAGLPGHCTVEDLLESLAPVIRVTREPGTRDGRRFQVAEVERSLAPEHIELWIPEGEQNVAVIECANPSIENLDETLNAWGPPEWVLNEKRFAQEAIVTERVYASRGITLSVAEFSPDPSRRRLAVVNIQLYRPVTVESYLADTGAIGVLESHARIALRGLERALAGDLLAWRGLSGVETVEGVAAIMKPLTGRYASADKERMSHRFSVFTFDRAAPPSPVELWVLTGQNFVTLVEYDDPPAIALEQTLAAAGPPELVLENRRFAQGASVKEYVYARRGLTLSVAEPYEGSVLQSRRLTHAQLYRASSAIYYWRYIGPGPELHPFPSPSAASASADNNNYVAVP